MSSLVGAQRFFNSNYINYKIILNFAIPSLIGVFICRKWIIQFIPESIDFFQFFTIQKDALILVLFAILMLLASFSTLFSWKLKFNKKLTKNNLIIILIDGFVLGIITGFVGRWWIFNCSSVIILNEFEYEGGCTSFIIYYIN